MASIIKADTLQSTTANVFVLNSSGTEYARFDSSGVFQLANPTTFPAGTAALPSITATGDTNTGIFFPAADTIAFAEGGAEAMRIDTSGNVGIGTDAPSTYGKFVVAGGDGNTQFNVGTNGVLRVAGYISSYSGALLESVNTTQSAYLPIAINGSYAVVATGNTERMRIDSSGRVLVNSTTDVGGNNPVFSANAGATFSNIMEARWTGTASIYHLLIRNGNGLIGGVTSSGSTTAFLTSSDYRLKEYITPMTGALAKVSALKPITYKWKVDGSDGEGFIAHELAEVCPIAVHGEKDELNEDGSIKSQSIDTSFLVATLTAAIQEQQALITALTAITTSQTEAITALTARIAALESTP